MEQVFKDVANTFAGTLLQNTFQVQVPCDNIDFVAIIAFTILKSPLIICNLVQVLTQHLMVQIMHIYHLLQGLHHQ